jgi:hypothetical protein
MLFPKIPLLIKEGCWANVSSGDKYFPGHQYKVKVQMLLGQDQEDMAGVETSVPSVEEGNMAPEEAIVSLHATHSSPHSSTMRFKGYIGKISVCALINSGSTHSFVDPSVLHGQQF